jgi:hypothetical protein
MVLKRLVQRYQASYDKRPILTLCCTNGILGIIGDGLAQGINHREGVQHHHSIVHNQLPSSLQADDIPPPGPFQFDVARNARFALYNFSVAPLVGTWYMFLDRFFPAPVIKPANVAKKVIQRSGDIVALKRMVSSESKE